MHALVRLAIVTALVLATPVSAGATGTLSRAQVAEVSRLVDRADQLEERHDQKGAIALYTRAIAIDPRYAYAFASRCQSEWEIDRNSDALRDCWRAAALDPSSAYAYRGLALAQDDLGSTSEAIVSANKGIALDPTFAFGFVVRCRVRIDLEEYGSAIDDCNRAISMKPTVAMGHFERGRAELADAQYPAAETDMTWVIERKPSETTAYYNRALARLHTLDLAGADNDIDTYIAVYPDRGKGYYTKARIEQARMRFEAARAAARQALNAYQRAGDTEGATKAQEFLDENDLTSTAGVAAGVFFIIVGVLAWITISVVMIVALWRILDRAGFQGTYALFAIVPLGYLVCLSILAFAKWEPTPPKIR